MRSTRPGSTHPAPSTPSSPGTFLDRAWQGYQLHLFLAWGIFNPNGPTLNCVGLRRRRDDDAPELLHRWLHVTGSGTTVLGQVRPGPEGWDDALRLLQDAFAGPDADTLVTAIPTFVVSNLPERWEGLQWELLAATRTVQQADWGRELDLLRRHGRDLFARAGEEAWREVRRLQAQDPDALETRLLAARHASVVDPVGPDAPPLPSAPWAAELYDEWKAVAGNANFSAHALFLSAHAWVGAIHLLTQYSNPNGQRRQGGLSFWHPFEALQAFFAACRLPLFGDAEEAAPLTSAALARGLGIPTPPEPQGFDPAIRFPLTDVLHDVIRSGGAGHEGVPPRSLILATNGFGWPGEGRATLGIRVDVRGARVDGDPVAEEVVCLARAPWLDGLTDAEVAELNQLAAVAGLAHEPISGKLILASKVGIHEADQDAAERLYAPILAPWSLAAEWTLEQLRLGGGAVDPANSPFSGGEGQPAADAPPPVEPHEWEHVRLAGIEAYGFLGTDRPGQLTAEFPWDPGAWTRMVNRPEIRKRMLDDGEFTREQIRRMGGRTSLLQVTTEHRHPLFGRGIRATLSIPAFVKGEGAVQLCRELNRWELETPELPPFFGAWVPGIRGPMFLTFVPSALCVPGLLLNLVHWARRRAPAVRRWFEGGVEAGVEAWVEAGVREVKA